MGHWPSPCRASPSSPFDCFGSSTKLRQHAFRDLELVKLVRQLCPFAIKPRELFGNSLLLPSNRFQCRHIPLSLDPRPSHNTTMRPFCDNSRINARRHFYRKGTSARDAGNCRSSSPTDRGHCSTCAIIGAGLPRRTIQPFRSAHEKRHQVTLIALQPAKSLRYALAI